MQHQEHGAARARGGQLDDRDVVALVAGELEGIRAHAGTVGVDVDAIGLRLARGQVGEEGETGVVRLLPVVVALAVLVHHGELHLDAIHR